MTLVIMLSVFFKLQTMSAAKTTQKSPFGVRSAIKKLTTVLFASN